MNKTALFLLSASLLFSCSEKKAPKPERTVEAPTEETVPEAKAESLQPRQ